MRMQNGDLGLSFGAAVPGYQKWNNRRLLLRSRDEGKTFYSQTECQPQEYHNQFGLNNSRVERLSSGRLLLTMHTHPGAKKDDPKARVSRYSFGVISYSDDDGLPTHPKVFRRAAYLKYVPEYSKATGAATKCISTSPCRLTTESIGPLPFSPASLPRGRQ